MNFRKQYQWLMPMIIFIGALLIGRMVRTGSVMFLFIPWNLILAVVPLYISYHLVKTNSRIGAGVLMLLWLLFFPNAMYIITDLFHLVKREHVPLWYDLILLFSSAILGAIMGFLSVINVEQYLRRFINHRSIPWVILSFFLLCGYGVYLGRYLRWNSWDVIADPVSLMGDMLQDIIHPFRNKQCWMLTLFFGVWLQIMYRYFKKVRIG